MKILLTINKTNFMYNLSKTLAMFSVLSLLAVGCQKEFNTDYSPETSISEECNLYKVRYSIDGIQHYTIHHNKKEHSAFIYYLLDLAEQGHKVEFCNENISNNTIATKETVYYSTDNKTNALQWASNMEAEGYKVIITYDPENKIYNCVAWK